MIFERKVQVLSRGPFVVSEFVLVDAIHVSVLQMSGASPPSQVLFSREGGGYGEAWPLSEALRVDTILKREGVSALFAAVSATPNRVSVCTAGDIRVHLIQAGRLQNTTRDHVYATDRPEMEGLSAVPPEVLSSAVTRYVGGTEATNPEIATWEVSGEYTVIICSAEVHGRRAPASYLESLAERERLPDVEGFLCKIDVFSR